MRVLHLGAGNLFGGIERFLVGLAQLQIAHPSADHHFLLTHEGRLSSELRNAGAGLNMVPIAPRLSRPWTIIQARRFTRGLVKDLKPDVVVSHGPWAHVVLGAGVPQSVPRVFFLHGPASGHWLDRLAGLRPPVSVLTNSEYSRRTVESAFPGVSSQVVRYVLPDQSAPNARERVRSSLGVGAEVVLLHVSRLERWKGHTLLFDALARMRVSQAWVLWIAGGPQRPAEVRYLDQLRTRVAELHLTERVRFLGERADVPQLLAAADIFCQTNLEPEPLGLSIVEALSAGLPVVTMRAGGPAEFLDPNCALLLDGQDPDLLATQLARLVEEEEARRMMGKQARDLYEREFEPVVCSDKFSEVLGRVATSGTEAAWG